MSSNIIQRPPIISVMGHVDHGKSALLDYIRKTNVVQSEAGGITQHVSAYELEHDYEGMKRKITFLDTPGHEAFKEIRKRGASVADIAILVVAADDGVKTQTLDALEAIRNADIPFVVAINKIDLPNANIQKVQSDLIEHGVYIEGMGGDVPWVAVSAKSGEGVNDLLDTLLLLADMLDLKADKDKPASGVILESEKDRKRGISATLIIKEGTLNSGDFVVAEDVWAPVRIFEDFQGSPIKSATFSSPVRVVGFSDIPEVGVMFNTVKSKKEAEKLSENAKLSKERERKSKMIDRQDKYPIHVAVLADTSGSKDAILYELNKLESEKAYFDVLSARVGEVSKEDLEMLATAGESVLLSFNSKANAKVKEMARQLGIQIENFNIIYNLSDFAKRFMEENTPKIKQDEIIGKASVLKIFSSGKKSYVLGGKVLEGVIELGERIKIERRGVELGMGRIKTLQSDKKDVQTVAEGSMFGMQIETPVLLAEGDDLFCIKEVEK